MSQKTKEELLAELAELEAQEEAKKALGQPIPLADAETGAEPIKEISIVKKLKEIPPEPFIMTLGDTNTLKSGYLVGPKQCEHLRPRTDNTEATCFLYRAHPNKHLAFDPRSAPDRCTSKLSGCTDYE